MSLYETETKAIVTTINNETKIALFSEPLYRYEVKTVASDDRKTVNEAAEEFHMEIANSFGLFASTITIYKNVYDVENLVLRLEKLFKDDFASEKEVCDIVEALQEKINDAYASGATTTVSF